MSFKFQVSSLKLRRAVLAALLSAPFIASMLLPIAQRAGAQGDGGAARNSASGKIEYPETKRGEVVDDYFGTKVPDPYRWLEDDNARDVAAWVEAENKVTFGYLDKISYRAQLKDRLTKLFN